MNSRRAGAVAVVLGLGVGLHFAARSLASQLPQLFPQIAREIPRSVEPPLSASLSPEPAPPPMPAKKLVLKRSGAEAVDNHPWVSASLVRSSSIPLLPHIEAGEWDVDFPIPPSITAPVEFWKKIYGSYDTHQVVLHDDRYLEVQYAVLDFHQLDSDPDRSDAEKRAIRESEVNREIKRIQEGIEDPEARGRVRAQVGLRDKFLEGLQRSGRYLPIFEEIFEGYGLPKKLTRLAFVESLFKEKAFSKVGAAGLWQFMPSTGKKFLAIDRLIDERYDPILATHAAARLLKKNYELLGSWPLAINAYNTGAGHLLRAIEQLGTTDIGKIIWNYGNADYSFASRNFYPEFLAALDLVENEQRQFGQVNKDPPMEFDIVEIPVTMTFPEIAALSGVSLDDLHDLHPSFAPVVFQGKYALPAGTEVRLPRGNYTQFAARFIEKYMNEAAAAPASVLANEKRYEERP